MLLHISWKFELMASSPPKSFFKRFGSTGISRNRKVVMTKIKNASIISALVLPANWRAYFEMFAQSGVKPPKDVRCKPALSRIAKISEIRYWKSSWYFVRLAMNTFREYTISSIKPRMATAYIAITEDTAAISEKPRFLK